MTDKQIIETLVRIKEYCRKCKTCKECKFLIDKDEKGDGNCQIQNIFYELDGFPSQWDMEELERIIKQ